MFYNKNYIYKGPNKYIRDRLDSLYLDKQLSRAQIIGSVQNRREKLNESQIKIYEEQLEAEKLRN